MKTFGWICFWLGIAFPIISLLLGLLTEAPFLIGKVLLASGASIFIGWKLAHPKEKYPKEKYIQHYCIECGNRRLQEDNFCTNCGVRLEKQHG